MSILKEIAENLQNTLKEIQEVDLTQHINDNPDSIKIMILGLQAIQDDLLDLLPEIYKLDQNTFAPVVEVISKIIGETLPIKSAYFETRIEALEKQEE